MLGVSAVVLGQVQEVKARNLQTLMAVLDEISSAAGLASDHTSRHAPGAQSEASSRLLAGLGGAEVPKQATVLLPPQGNRLTLSLGGMPLEVVLPDTLAAAAKANPALLARGTLLQVEVDAESGVLRLSLPTPDLPGNGAATLRQFSQIATGPSAAPPPPLPDHFPPGSPGALVQKLAQVHLPLAERSDAPAGGPAAPPLSGSRGLGPSALATLPPALLEASLKAAIRQLPLGPAISALLASTSASDAKGIDPEPLEALRHLRLDALVKPDAPAIEKGVKQSGLFFEARLADLALGQGTPPRQDLKALLNIIRGSLADAADAEIRPAKPAPAHLLAAADRPEAPAPRGQDLARLVEGGLERIKLQQIASLPDHPGMTVTDDRAQPSRIALQIPLATQGAERPETAMIGVMIEHDPRPELPAEIRVDEEGGQGGEAFPWKVRIALDLEETGPVQAEIGLRGQRVGVTLWAERKAIAEDARRAIGDLHKALTGAAFEVAHLDVKDGRPSAAAPRHMPHLDRRS